MGKKRRNKVEDREQGVIRSKRRRIILSSSDEDEIEDPVSRGVTPTSAPDNPPPQVLPSSEPVIQPSTSTDQELDDDILQLLGDPPKSDVTLGPNIHKDIATRWQEILSKGLANETKEQLLKEYNVPQNCDFLIPPILNPEVKAALPESLVRRDSMLSEKQKHLGFALAALGRATQMLIDKENHKVILKTVSDACRLLCDIHHNESKTRRNFAISAINPTMKEVLSETSRGKYLFGEIEEKIKTAKNIQKSGADLKPVQPKRNPKFRINNFVKPSLNTRATLRRNSRPDAGKSQTARSAPTQPSYRAAARAATRRPATTRRRSPPPHRNSHRRT